MKIKEITLVMACNINDRAMEFNAVGIEQFSASIPIIESYLARKVNILLISQSTTGKAKVTADELGILSDLATITDTRFKRDDHSNAVTVISELAEKYATDIIVMVCQSEYFIQLPSALISASGQQFSPDEISHVHSDNISFSGGSIVHIDFLKGIAIHHPGKR